MDQVVEGGVEVADAGVVIVDGAGQFVEGQTHGVLGAGAGVQEVVDERGGGVGAGFVAGSGCG